MMTGERAENPEFVLYSRADCHLCDVLQQELRALLDGVEFRLSIVDISTSDCLIRQYGARIPVLTADGVELCHYHLDAKRVQGWLAS